jgi:hypothetical protein
MFVRSQNYKQQDYYPLEPWRSRSSRENRNTRLVVESICVEVEGSQVLCGWLQLADVQVAEVEFCGRAVPEMRRNLIRLAPVRRKKENRLTA